MGCSSLSYVVPPCVTVCQGNRPIDDDKEAPRGIRVKKQSTRLFGSDWTHGVRCWRAYVTEGMWKLESYLGGRSWRWLCPDGGTVCE